MAKTKAIPRAKTIYTVGHSNRELDELIRMLSEHQVQGIADVRRFAKSRRVPQFNDEHLSQVLPGRGLEYLSFASLGGRRQASKTSVNDAWRNASFRGYADFMQTPAFEQALNELIDAAAKRRLAIMCAEAVPWRCHRSLIADALLVRGWTVLDIMSATKASEHKLTPFAQVNGTRITYPAIKDDEALFPQPDPVLPRCKPGRKT